MVLFQTFLRWNPLIVETLGIQTEYRYFSIKSDTIMGYCFDDGLVYEGLSYPMSLLIYCKNEFTQRILSGFLAPDEFIPQKNFLLLFDRVRERVMIGEHLDVENTLKKNEKFAGKIESDVIVNSSHATTIMQDWLIGEKRFVPRRLRTVS